MRRLFYSDTLSNRDSIGLLLLRVAVGIAFMHHGWPKIQAPMSWMGDALPGPLQAAAAVAEFVGGAALRLGLLTRLAALALAITMAVAAGMVHIPKGDPFVAGKPGAPSWELAGIYFCCAVLFLLAGPGRISLDAVLFRPRASAE